MKNFIISVLLALCILVPFGLFSRSAEKKEIAFPKEKLTELGWFKSDRDRLNVFVLEIEGEKYIAMSGNSGKLTITKK